MNTEIKPPTERVLDVIAAIKAKGDAGGADDKGVDLVAIVKKLTRNRERAAKRAGKTS